MIRTIAAIADRAAPILAVLLAAALVSCGGGVSGPPAVNDPTRITILPDTATLYSGLPTTFVLSGGTGAYFVSSSNQSVVPVSGFVNGSTLVVVPNPVAIDTTVTLTVRDSGATPTVSATLTVHPGTVSNNITIAATSTQGCSPAICSGGDASVSVTISQGGIPLAARGIQFDVVSGDFRFITSAPGAATETLATSIIVATDQSGLAQARIRVTPAAPNQTALLRITDIASGAFQNASFVIAQSTGSSPGFFALPASVTFTGVNDSSCANNVTAQISVFGGQPPYTVSGSSTAFQVGPTVIAASGGSFGVRALGVCTDTTGVQLVVSDSGGNTTMVTLVNKLGTLTTPPLVVAPTAVTLTNCTGTATATVAGGTGNAYIVSSGSSSVLARLASGNAVSIQRTPNSPATSSPVQVSISDSVSVATVDVTLTGDALGACPTPTLTVSPASVPPLTDCSAQSVTLSGGTGTYTAVSSSANVIATVTGAALTIQLKNPTTPAPGTQSVTVSSGSQQQTIMVNATGTCP